MALPRFIEMIEPILKFGAERGGDIDGIELRRRLPQIMNIAPEDLVIRQPRGVETMFEIHLRHAIKGAGSQGLLKNLGGKQYRVTEAGLAKLGEKAPVEEQAGGEPPPEGTWFARAYQAQYRSEKEVDIRFVVPLLEHLGYGEEDRADGYWMRISSGSARPTVQADFVCYDGQRSRSPSLQSCLLIVETKSRGHSLQKAVDQARSYAQELKPLCVLVTDGEEIQVWKLSTAAEDRCVFTCSRRNLYKEFQKLSDVVSKSVLASEKKANFS